MIILLILFILAFAGVSLGDSTIPATATIILKDGTEVYGQISQQELTFHTKEGKLRIRLENIKSFESGKLELRDGSVLSGKLKDDLSINEDGSTRVLEKRNIVSIVIEDIPGDTVAKGSVEPLNSEGREDEELKKLTGGEGKVPTDKVPPPPPPPNYTKIFKDPFKTASDGQSYLQPDHQRDTAPDMPVNAGRPNILEPSMNSIFKRLGTVSKPLPPPTADTYEEEETSFPSTQVEETATTPQSQTQETTVTPPEQVETTSGTAVVNEEITDMSAEELEGLSWEEALKE